MMQASAVGAFAPAVLLCAALGSWSVISLLFLLAFFVVQYKSHRRAPPASPRPMLWMAVVLLATTVIVTEGVFELLWATLGTSWKFAESPLLKLLGLARLNPLQGSLGGFLSLLPQFAVALTAACALYQEQQLNHSAEELGWDEERSNWRANFRNFVLPAAQVVVGVARPSWIALPYFVCSCVGLLHWSMTSKADGLSWGWRPLLWCTGIHIFLLYTYQLPVTFPERLSEVAKYVGLFKASEEEIGWPECVQAVSLVGLYILLCIATNDLQGDHSSQGFTDDGSLTEDSGDYGIMRSPPSIVNGSLTQRLLSTQLPPSHVEAIPSSRSWGVDQRRATAIRHATSHFITYGFPICLLALVCWSFVYASLCAFVLLLYVGYIFYAFPSVVTLRRLNPILLGFILSWTLSTYVFNAAYSVISDQTQMGMEIWHSIGLWHYLAPGLFIFAQFALGVLVATDIFVSNVVIANISDAENPDCLDEGFVTADKEDWKMLILAVIAWCLSRSAYVISLVLILVVGLKDGLLHAVYIGFFLVYLVSSKVAKRTRRHLILFCELHFAALYMLQLDWISAVMEAHEEQLKPILVQLGLWNKGKFQDFLCIALLLCFLAVQSHGLKVLSSLSANIQQSTPRGWGILTVGSGRSVLLSVYASQSIGHLQQENSTDVNWVTKHLAAIAETVRSTYRSFGTYIAYGTVLTVINFVEPNYISLGYLCLLLFWVIGRQIMGHTKAQLWYPLMIFAGGVFIFRYTLSAIPSIQEVLSTWFSLKDDFGFTADASLVGHLWDSLAILVAMQLYRFERGQIANLAEEQYQVSVAASLDHGIPGFVKRLLILHAGKVLTLAGFYACITPVSASGFLYLVMVIVTCNMSKSSRLPGQLYAIYTGFLAVTEYLFQMWGNQAEMFPGQTHGDFAYWLGLRVYGDGFLGKESGLRSKVFVLAACILQYCSFHWLSQLPASLRVHEQYGEPCLLFLPYHRPSAAPHQVDNLGADLLRKRSTENMTEKVKPSDSQIAGPSSVKHGKTSTFSEDAENGKLGKSQIVGSPSAPDFSNVHDRKVPGSPNFRDSQRVADKPSLSSPWGSAKESRRWGKRAMLLLKQERYEAQLRTLSIYMKHIVENFCQLYGLEMSMLSLLVGSFALLNVVSLLYVFLLGVCIVLSRKTLRVIWAFFVILVACILVTEYAVLGNRPPSWNVPPALGESEIQCNNCVYVASSYPEYCWRCWLGVVVDDRQMLIAHFMVFLVTSLQLHANMSVGDRSSESMHVAHIHPSDRLVWKELSYETSSQWTWLDHARFFFYRHLLHVVLLLVFATGTLQYDVLHLGYLTFSLVFFRMRSTIMTKRNSIFRFLRLYNFILIAASLLYQAPYFGFLESEQCAVIGELYKIVGLYKMKFGFKITARSAVVDITIFCVAGLQAYIFRSSEFSQVLRFLESEQVEARAHAQEHKAAWKKEHLQGIRAMEERKFQRRLQVEKMKTDILHLQLRLDVLDSAGKFNEVLHPMIELDDRGSQYSSFPSVQHPESVMTDNLHAHERLGRYPSDSDLYKAKGLKDDVVLGTVDTSEGSDANLFKRRRRIPDIRNAPQGKYRSSDGGFSAETSQGKPAGPQKIFTRSEAQSSTVVQDDGSFYVRTSSHSDHPKRSADQQQKQGLLSGVQLLEDGVTHVQNFGNKALENLVGLFNLDSVEVDDADSSSADGEAQADESNHVFEGIQPVHHHQLADSQAQKLQISDTWRRLCMLGRYFWSEIESNTDIVCYIFFVLAYTWNFSLLTLIYPATLFFYALLVNPGPSQQFWFVMLVYTELNILVQYMYQIHVHNCDGQELSGWLRKLGIPGATMDHSFVVSVLPLFLVYLTTLVQSSIKARDGEWLFVDEARAFSSRHLQDVQAQSSDSYSSTVKTQLWRVAKVARDALVRLYRGLSRSWRSLKSGSEAPPHFVQVSLHVGKWPDDGIQPERIESGFNKLLVAVHQEGFSGKDPCSRVRVESIENSPGKPTMALAVLEVIYAAPCNGSVAVEGYQTLTPAADVAAELQKAKDEGLVEETGFPYPIVSLIPGGKRELDLYAPIFGVDLAAFLYVALLYQATLKHSDQLLGVYQVEDQFPKEFVVVLLTLFFLMMVDRVLYLCYFATGKVFYYFFCLGLYTFYVTQFVWEILAAPGTGRERHFWQLLPFRGFYLLKALSLSLQAVQLKYGLPHKSALFGQFLMRKINSMSWLGFRLYRSLPFLYELRCLLDWSCTTTALSMYDWLKLEDIYASLFLVQCDIKLHREKRQLGQKQGMWIKFVSGILIFLTLIGIIWAPMLIYSSGNPTNIVNQIIDVRARIELRTTGGKFILFETGLCRVPFVTEVLDSSSDVMEDPYAYLSSYDLRDVQLICCEEDAESLWMIPPPTLKRLIDSIDDSLIIQFRWEFNRDRPKGKESTVIEEQAGMNSSLIARQLRAVLNGTLGSFNIPRVYSRYFRVPGTGDVHTLEETQDPDMKSSYVSGNLSLNHDGAVWWSFVRDHAYDGDGCATAKGPMVFTVSEEVPRGIIGETLSKFSIWSLYITFVLAVGRFIRLQCSDIRMRIPFENFPACDRLLAICEDIYAARSERELELEEGLFWTLIKIYRSPHILMEYTKVE